MRRLTAPFLSGLLLCLAGCQRPSVGPRGEPLQLTVAAAANLSGVFPRIGERFQAQTGIRPVFSFGATALLAQQIEHAAPFDVVAAADSAHVEELARKGLVAADSRAVYAEGVLALWAPPRSRVRIGRLEDVASPEVHVIAMAKPEMAPYGQASVETLTKLGLWQRCRGRVVYAENISVAKQYGTSNNADAVFTAYSLVRREGGTVLKVDGSLHRPLSQELAIVAGSQHQEAARKFVAFLLGSEGRKILSDEGYRLPARRDFAER